MENHLFSKASVHEAKLKPGQFVEVEVVIIASRPSGEHWIGIAKDDSGIISIISKRRLVENHKYIIKGKTLKKNNSILIKVIELEKMKHGATASAKIKEMDFLYEGMNKLKEDVLRMAQHMIDIAESGEQIVVKYDSDADGLCGALTIYRMLKCMGRDAAFMQNRSPVYTVEDALLDAAHHGGAHFIFIDYPNNIESDDGLKLLGKHAASIAIIDHHLSKREKGDELVVTPVWHGLGAEYTSGYLCYEIARRACQTDYGKLWIVSLYCDKSTLEFEFDQSIEETGLVLDYLAATMKRERRGITFIDKLIRNEEMRHAIYLTAVDKVNSLTKLAINIAKRRTLKNNILLIMVDLDKIVEQNQFPQKGKVVGKVHDWFVEHEPKEKAIITLGYGSNSIMARANKTALSMGFNANDIIQDMKKAYGNVIIAGGGHPGAAAVRFRKGFKRVILNALVEKIELTGAER